MSRIPVPFDFMAAVLRRGRRTSPAATEAGPLDHPALRRLGPRELADLTLPRPEAGPPGRDALAPGQSPLPEPHDRPCA